MSEKKKRPIAVTVSVHNPEVVHVGRLAGMAITSIELGASDEGVRAPRVDVFVDDADLIGFVRQLIWAVEEVNPGFFNELLYEMGQVS